MGEREREREYTHLVRGCLRLSEDGGRLFQSLGFRVSEDSQSERPSIFTMQRHYMKYFSEYSSEDGRSLFLGLVFRV